MEEERYMNIHEVTHKFACVLTKDGKKAKAERIVQRKLALLHTDQATAAHMFIQAVDNVKPLFELKRVRVSGMTHQIPALISPARQTSIALRWIVQSVRADKKLPKTRTKSFESVLARHLQDAVQMRGAAVLKKQGVHKIAEANRAFAHYRWW